MLYFPQTRIDLSKERPIATGYTFYAEGSAAAWVDVAGSFGVAPTTGTNDVFAGVTFNSVISPTTIANIEQLATSSANQIATSFPWLAGTLQIVNAAGTVMTAATPGTAVSSLTATQYVVDATVSQLLDVNPVYNPQGTVFTVYYRYSPTAFQQLYAQGMPLPGGAAGLYLGQIDIIQHGDVYTDQFDTTANWATAVGVTLEANGMFGATATLASAVPGTTLIAPPTLGNPYIGISINVA